MKILFGIMLGGMLSLSVSAGYDFIIDGGYTPGITLQGNQTLFMTGGGLGDLTLYNDSSAMIQDTSVLNQFIGGVWLIRLSGNSKLSIEGGQVYELDINYSALAMISGGRIDSIYGYQSAWKYEGQPSELVWNPHITIICQPDWIYNTQSKMLKGSWLDGSKFNIQLVDVAGYSPVIENIRFIPEPATFAMIGLGGALLRRRK
jgi:hypothetical protein